MSVSTVARKSTAALISGVAVLALAAPAQALAGSAGAGNTGGQGVHGPSGLAAEVAGKLCGLPLPKPLTTVVGNVAMCVNGWQ
ncbi:hypothetical protein ACFWU3_05190 [Streptomyces sp. NPDC058685]|uniref:hypothetical protein n=1 Tax=Streptomyces sp. NPDC058685 TaxID=3346598 RepID=UPI0036575EB3